VNHLILSSENESKHIRTGVELTHQAREHLNRILSGAESSNEAMKQILQATLQEKTATSQVFTTLKVIQQGIEQSTQALNQTTLITTELTVLADELNQMVTELQGKNETGNKPQV
jgi:methyl-accepting chemotaxis protein